MKSSSSVRSEQHQQGAVLVVSLIMLLVVTILGVGAMDVSLMELKMTGNYQQQILALNDAERNVLVAEMAIEDIVNTAGRFNFNAAEDGYYDSSLALQDIDSWGSLSQETGAGTTNTHQYIVEYIGKKQLPGESIATSPDGGIPGDSAFAYLVTARSEVGKGATRIVQSAYTTFDRP